MKTSKLIQRIGIGLAVVIILAAVLIKLFADGALKAGIETIATKTLNVGVTVKDVDLSLLKGDFEMEGLVIDNPAGYEHKTMLEMSKLFVATDLGSLLSDTINIKEINLDGINLVIEQKGFTNNLKQILDSLPKEEKTEPSVASKEESGAGKKLHIDKVTITNTSVKVKLLPIPGKADTVTLKIAPIEIPDIGEGSEMTTAQLIKKIMSILAASVVEQGKGLLPDDLTGSLKSGLTGLKNAGTEVLEQGKNVGQDVLEKGKDLGEEVKDTFKGLLQPKK